MITKFFSKPTRTRASAKNTIKYLCGGLDGTVTREGAKLLKGDILLSLALAESVIRKNQFTVGCLSFKEAQIDEHKKHEIMADFERTALAGLNEDDYNILWIEHTDKDRLEMNFFIPRMELTTGNDLQPFYAGSDLEKMDLWKDCINIEYQLHAPQDDPQPIAFKPDWYRTSGNRYVQNVGTIRDQIDKYFTQKIEAGEVNSRADIIEILDIMGLEPKPAKNYITITPPPIENDDGTPAIDPKTNQQYEQRNVRLKGNIYNDRSDQFIQESRAETGRKYHERYLDQLPTFRRDLDGYIRRDAERNIKRYEAGRRRAERQTARADRELASRADPTISANISHDIDPAPATAEITAEPAGTAERRDRDDQPTHSHAENTGGAGDLHPVRFSRHQPQSAENSGANPPISPANSESEKGNHVHGWHSWHDGVSDRTDDLASGATIRPAGDSESGAGTLWRSIADDSDHERASQADRIAEKRDPSINPANQASPTNSRADQSPAGTPTPARIGAVEIGGRASESPAGSPSQTSRADGGTATETGGADGGSSTQGGRAESQSGERPPATMREESDQQIFMQLGAENEQANISIFDTIRNAFTDRISRAINSVRDITERTRKLIKSLSTSEEQQREWQEISAGAIRDNKDANSYNQRLRTSASELERATAHTDKRRTAINTLAGKVNECDSDTEKTDRIIDKYTGIVEQRTSARLEEATRPAGATLASENRQEASRDRSTESGADDSERLAEYIQERAGERTADQGAIQGTEQHIERTKQQIIDTDNDITHAKQRTGEQSQYIDWFNHKIQSHVQRLEAEKQAEQQREAERLERIRLAEIEAEKAKKSEQNNDYSSPSPFD